MQRRPVAGPVSAGSKRGAPAFIGATIENLPSFRLHPA
jgi:hypothetical protein